MKWSFAVMGIVAVVVIFLLLYAKDTEDKCEAVGGVPVREYYGGIVCIDKDVVIDDD